MATVRTGRVYDPPAPRDGTRILVMRFWPRGVRKERVDEWMTEVAPSRELVLGFKHKGLPWREFVRRYRAELPTGALERLRARKGTITLLCGCAEEERCHRGLLRNWIAKLPPPRTDLSSRLRSRRPS